MFKKFAVMFGLAVFVAAAAIPAESAAASGNYAAVATPALVSIGPKVPVQGDSQVMAGPSPDLITAGTYAFGSATGVALEDMSSGTTQLVAAGSDDGSSGLASIGFDYWYDGVRFTQFGANANGYIRLGAIPAASNIWDNSVNFATTNDSPKIAPLYDDLCVGTTGKVHYKTTGAAPNRKLIIEWQNMQITRGAGCSGPGAGTFQLWLFETTGGIESVYGAGMTASLDGGYSVGLQSGAATNIASVTTSTSTVSYAAANNTQTDAIAAGAAYTFSPNVPVAPTGLTFAPVAPTTIQLNWTDNASNEVGYAIYRSLDGLTYSFLTQTAANAVTFNDIGLNPSTTYWYQVYAVTEGALSTVLSGSQATAAAGNIVSTAGGGNWSDTATWVGGAVPTVGDSVTIASTATVTIDVTTAVCIDLTVNGTLQYIATPAATLTTTGNVIVAAGGTFQSAATGTVTTHVLSVGKNLTNNGTLDFSTNADTAGAGITFTGAANNTFGGTGATTDVRAITVVKTANSNVLTVNPSNFTVRGVNNGANGFLTVTSGTFKMDGTFAYTGAVWTAPAYTIPAAGGFWLNNPNANVAAQTGNGTLAGLFRLTAGTYNHGTAAANGMIFSANSTITVEGGALNVAGRFGVTAAATAINYTQSGTPVITLCTVGCANSTSTATFDLGTSLTSVITITGGTVVLQLASTAASGPRDYRNQAGGGIAGITGSTVQFGNAASGAAKNFFISGVAPNIVISNTSGNHTLTYNTGPVNYNNLSLDVTINSGNTFNAGNVVYLFDGTTFTNNGTFTHTGASSQFVWFNAAAPVLYTGSGTVTAPMTAFSVQADQGLTISAASPNIVTNRVIVFSGNIINANRITLGTGTTSTGTVQIGNTTTPTAAGTFDVPMTFNLGSGGQVISYLRTTVSRSTGGEINPTRILTTFSYDDNDPTHTLTIAGGDLAVTGTTTLVNGRIVTGANTLITGTTVTRTAGYVDGNLRKTFTAAGSKTFEVGTANGYSPVAFNNVTGTFPANVTATAIQTTEPIIFPPSKAITRYWTLTASDITSDLTFTYLDPTDIPGTVTEANLHVYRREGATTTFTDLGGAGLNAGANTATVTGISTFSNWTLAEEGATPVQLMNYTVE